MSDPVAVCRPRNPTSSDYYIYVEDHFEVFVRIYDEHCSRQYRFWRPYVRQVIYRYLVCGDFHNGFYPGEVPVTSGNTQFKSKLIVEDL